MKEKAFLKSQGDRYMKNRLRNDFKTARNIFEKRLRSAEREYRRSLAINVEQVSTENPKAFWDHIKQLGPKRKGSIPMEVYGDDKISYQMKILYFRNGRAILKTFIMLNPMRILMTDFTTKFCLKNVFRRWNA